MAKTMALLAEGTVVNVIWCADSQTETVNLKNPGDHPVGIGDTYSDGKWYRDGVEILTPIEEELARLKAENADMREALDTIYQGVSE